MDFYKRVSIVCMKIPYGKAATYGQIALLCGKPRNSRQVGFALRKGLTGGEGGEIPAHRIMNHQGFLSGAKAFSQPDTQQRLLEAEGVEVDDELRVDLKKYGWKNTLKDAMDLRAVFKELGI